MEAQRRILWVDDEIDLLRPHIILLEQRGYLVSTSSNGADAIEMVRRGSFGLVFLDESMVGMSGLEVLEALKSLDASLPVVMVTKNEQESLMDEAIGRKIDDYLTKPVNPAQILAACKKFLESRRIAEQKFTQDYFKGFNELSARLSDRLTWEDWVDIYQKLVQWSIDLDLHPDLGFQQTLTDQWQEC
ncbi:MAG: response regulator, partial [Candidatus Kapaibacterium sp.]